MDITIIYEIEGQIKPSIFLPLKSVKMGIFQISR